MSKSTYKFHYVDESDNNTSPENASRVTLIMYDENQKISKRIEYLNKKDTGHYTVTPFTYKPKKGKKFVFKSTLSFYDELKKLIYEIKKN